MKYFRNPEFTSELLDYVFFTANNMDVLVDITEYQVFHLEQKVSVTFNLLLLAQILSN